LRIAGSEEQATALHGAASARKTRVRSRIINGIAR